jgi:hypothetical protein
MPFKHLFIDSGFKVKSSELLTTRAFDIGLKK